jgi:ketosteroid isomerase-like protein
MQKIAVKYGRRFKVAPFLALAVMMVAAPAGAQKKDKNKNKNASSSDVVEDIRASMHMPDSQAIDQAIGEALGYWQIGDVDSLHKYYADDIVMVSGAWEPPIVGWDNFVKSYQAQRARVTGIRLDRSNTVVKVSGNSAWATYQFVFGAQMDGKSIQYRGHTTLALVKQGERWIITLNHSSVVDSAAESAAAPIR